MSIKSCHVSEVVVWFAIGIVVVPVTGAAPLFLSISNLGIGVPAGGIVPSKRVKSPMVIWKCQGWGGGDIVTAVAVTGVGCSAGGGRNALVGSVRR